MHHVIRWLLICVLTTGIACDAGPKKLAVQQPVAAEAVPPDELRLAVTGGGPSPGYAIKISAWLKTRKEPQSIRLRLPAGFTLPTGVQWLENQNEKQTPEKMKGVENVYKTDWYVGVNRDARYGVHTITAQAGDTKATLDVQIRRLTCVFPD